MRETRRLVLAAQKRTSFVFNRSFCAPKERSVFAKFLLKPIACEGRERAALAFEAQQAVQKALFGAIPETQREPMRPAIAA